jgi:diguanylate cyclase (GGDEF)-like protein
LLRPQSREYGYFAAVAVCAATYCFLLTQWKYTLTSDFVFLKKTEHLMLYATPVLLVEFLWEFLGRRRNAWVRGAQILFAIGGLAVILSPGLEFALWLLPFLELYAFTGAIACLILLLYWWRQGDRNAGVVGLGILTLTIAMTHDGLVDRGLMVGSRIAGYGFAGLVIGVGIILAIRFHRAVEGLASLSRELEGRVKERTTELADAYGRMEELALRDPLTNLLNRRAISERASAGLSLAQRRKSPFSVALIDVDHFKAINDTHGHDSGDRVLVAVAQALGATSRVSDDVARWGGEEFLVLLPDTDKQASLLAAERLRAAVASMIIGANALRVAATVSVGVATTDSAAETAAKFEELVRRSDEALYRAKEGGRNRVIAA